MVGQFAVDGTLDKSFGQLLKKSVLTEKIIGLLIVLEPYGGIKSFAAFGTYRSLFGRFNGFDSFASNLFS
jgi:hypothetical protein